jgi:hypothetical protein
MCWASWPGAKTLLTGLGTLGAVRDTSNVHDLPPGSFQPPYVVTYRFTPFVVFFVPPMMILGAFVLVTVVLATRLETERPWQVLAKIGLTVMFAACAMFFLGAGWSYLHAAVTRRLALRIDSSGVTLGRAWPPTQAVFVPWPDIEHLVRFGAVNQSGTAQFVGVRLKPGAARPPGVPAPGSFAAKLRRFNAGFTPWPADLFRNARPWSLDQESLADAVRLHASHITIVWAGTRGYLG